jgi:hypothetical protein
MKLPRRQFLHLAAGPAIADLVAGHVPIIFLGLSASAPQVQSGKLRALAVTGRQRVAEFSDVPTYTPPSAASTRIGPRLLASIVVDGPNEFESITGASSRPALVAAICRSSTNTLL